MLVLTRREGDVVDITIGDVRIEVSLVRLGGNTARIGFNAPDGVKIVRREVTERLNAGSAE